MKIVLKIEELAQWAASAYIFTFLPFEWWWFWVLLLTPDLSMIPYMINEKWGAYSYNLIHHKALALGLAAIGLFLNNMHLLGAAVILYGHSSMDRLFGYGLKYTSGFKDTHLGTLK
jgi:hypothetical protein